MSNQAFRFSKGDEAYLVIAPNRLAAKKLAPEGAVGVANIELNYVTRLHANGKEISLSEQAAYPYSALTCVSR